MRGDTPQMGGVNRLLIVKTGEEDLQQIFTNGREGSLRREIGSVDVIDAPAIAVRLQDGIGDFSQVLIHVC
jgi:hypothetical protein